LDAPLARTPANFDPKSFFLVSYSPSPSCIPNLKLLALTIAEINNFLDAPLARPPANFIVKVVSRQATPQAQVVYQILKLLASTVTEINRGSQIFTSSPSPDPH